MSPTRRDVLKSFAIATVAAVLPKQALAAQDTFDSDATIDDAISDHLLSFEAISDRISAEHQEIQERLVRHANRASVWPEASGSEYIAHQIGPVRVSWWAGTPAPGIVIASGAAVSMSPSCARLRRRR